MALITLVVGIAIGWFGHKYFGPQVMAEIDAKIKEAEDKAKSKL